MKKAIFLFIILGLVIGSYGIAKKELILDDEDENGIIENIQEEADDKDNDKDKDKNDDKDKGKKTEAIDITPQSEFIYPKEGMDVKGEITIKLKVEQASSVEFYLKQPSASNPNRDVYIGSGVLKGKDKWEIKFDSTQNPNGEYNLFPKIINEYGEYFGEPITIEIDNKIEKDVEKEQELKEEIEEVEEEIKEEEEKIKQDKKKSKEKIKNEVKKTLINAKGAIKGIEKKEGNGLEEEEIEALGAVDDVIEEIVEKIEEEIELEQEIEEQEEELEEIGNKIEKAEEELDNLPDTPLPLVKKDKKEKLESYSIEKGKVKEKKKNSQKKLEKVKEEKEDLKEKVVETIEESVKPIEEGSPIEIKPLVLKVKEEGKKEVEEELKKLKDSVSKRVKNKIEKTQELLKDSDNDGLSDLEEIRLGTGPFNPDTDGDGFLDGVEYEKGYDVSNPSPAKKIIYQDPRKVKPKKTDIYKVERVESVILPTEERGLKLEGKGLPNSFITLHIFSLPIVVVVKTDGNGNWEYILDKPLADGEHTVYTTVTNNQGEIEARSEAFVFMKTEDKVFRIFESPQLAGIVSPVQNLQKSFTILVTGIIVLGVGIALILIGILSKKKKIIST